MALLQCRFLSKEDAHRLLVMMTALRPFERLAVAAMDGADRAAKLRVLDNNVWTTAGVQWTAATYSNVFASVMARDAKMAIGLLQYRHLHAHLSTYVKVCGTAFCHLRRSPNEPVLAQHRHIDDDDDVDDNSDDNWMDAQAVHSTSTRRRTYGRASNAVSLLAADLELGNLKASRAWLEFLMR